MAIKMLDCTNYTGKEMQRPNVRKTFWSLFKKKKKKSECVYLQLYFYFFKIRLRKFVNTSTKMHQNTEEYTGQSMAVTLYGSNRYISFVYYGK